MPGRVGTRTFVPDAKMKILRVPVVGILNVDSITGDNVRTRKIDMGVLSPNNLVVLRRSFVLIVQLQNLLFDKTHIVGSYLLSVLQTT